jgi:hypothetical protein
MIIVDTKLKKIIREAKAQIDQKLNDKISYEGQIYILKDFIKYLFDQGFTNYEIEKKGIRNILSLSNDRGESFDFGTVEVINFIQQELENNNKNYQPSLLRNLEDFYNKINKIRVKTYSDFIDFAQMILKADFLEFIDTMYYDLKFHDGNYSAEDLKMWNDLAKQSGELYKHYQNLFGDRSQEFLLYINTVIKFWNNLLSVLYREKLTTPQEFVQLKNEIKKSGFPVM